MKVFEENRIKNFYFTKNYSESQINEYIARLFLMWYYIFIKCRGKMSKILMY